MPEPQSWLDYLLEGFNLLGTPFRWEQETATQPLMGLVGKSLAGLPRPLLEQIARSGIGTVPGGQAFSASAKLGLGAQDVPDADLWGRDVAEAAYPYMNPLETLLAETALSPSTYLTAGTGPWAKIVGGLAARGAPGALLEGARGIELANQMMEAGIKGGASLLGQGARKGLEGVGEILPPVKGWLGDAPASTALQTGQAMGNVWNMLSPGMRGFLAPPLEKLSKSPRWLHEEGFPEVPRARATGHIVESQVADIIGKGFEGLEKSVATSDPALIPFKLLALGYGRTAAARLRSEVGQTWGFQPFDPTNVEGNELFNLAWQAHFENMTGAIQAVKDAFLDADAAWKATGKTLNPQQYEGLSALGRGLQRDIQTLMKNTKAEVKRVRERATQLGLAKQESVDLVNTVYSQRDDVLVEMYKKVQSDLQNLLGLEADPLASLLGNEAAQRFYSALEGLGVERAEGVLRPAGLGGVPERLRQEALPMYPLWQKELLKLSGAQRRLVKNLREGLALPATATWQEMLEVLAQRAGQPMPQQLDAETLQQLVIATPANLMRADNKNAIITALKNYEGVGDIISGDIGHIAISPASQAFERSLKGEGSTLPWDLGGKARTIGSFAGGLFKENILAAPAYHLMNGLSMLGVMGQKDPAWVQQSLVNAQDLGSRFRGGLRHPKSMQELLPTDYRNYLSGYGLENGDLELLGGSAAHVLGATEAARTFTSRVHPLARIAGFAALGAGGGPLGAAFGGLYGYLSKDLVRVSRDVASLMETAGRVGVWLVEHPKEMQKRLNPLLEDILAAAKKPIQEPGGELRRAVGRVLPSEPGEGLARGDIIPGVPGTPMTQFLPETLVRPIDLQKVYSVMSDLKNAGGRMSFKDFTARLADAGIRPEEVTKLEQKFLSTYDAANRAAKATVAARHVYYPKFTNLEGFLDAYIPFMRWGIRMSPTFINMVAENPAIITFLAHLDRVTMQDAEELGLKGTKYERLLRLGGDSFLASYMGQEGEAQAHINPYRLLNPYAVGTFGLGRELKFAENPVQALMDMVQSQYQPFPHVKVPLQAASSAIGRMGPEWMRGLLPYSETEPLPSVTRWGVAAGDSERGWQDMASRLLGLDPYQYVQAETQRRVGELGAEKYGYVDSPYVTAAKGLEGGAPGEAGKLYKQAAEQVQRERSVEGFINFFFPISAQIVRPSELKARQAVGKMPQGPYDTPEKLKAYQTAIIENKWAQVYQNVSGTETAKQLQYGLAALRDPSVLFPQLPPKLGHYLSRQLATYDELSEGAQFHYRKGQPLLTAALQQRSQFIERMPLLKAYSFWRQTTHPEARGEGEEGLMGQFLEWWSRGNRPMEGWTATP